MTTLHLVRHGETIWHAENRYTGSSDIPLTEHGRAQAAELAAWAVRHPPAALVASPLSRAVDTARPVADATGLPLATDARLREVDFGEGEGLTRAEMRERFPDALDAFLAAPATQPLPGGEAGTDAVARALPALRELADVHPDASVLVVMHSTLIRLLIAQFIGVESDRYRRVFPAVANCAVNTLRLGPDGPALLAYNVPTAR